MRTYRYHETVFKVSNTLGRFSLNYLDIQTAANQIVDEIEIAVVGKRDLVWRAVLTMFCDGHLLLEDIPGVGKTTLAKSLARVVGANFKRIQFTPDLLPADVTGASIYNQKEGTFDFRPGPVFTNIVLIDEINRATPKTQSALLESMEERQVSVDGHTFPLPSLFFVVATQNDLEMTGTYPLPEAQLDRFFARLRLGYPSREAEAQMIMQRQTSDPLESVTQVIAADQVKLIQNKVREVYLSDAVREYAVDVVRATREHALLNLGASPRGTIFLLRAAQANAAMSARDFVKPDDVKDVAAMTLAHRIIARGEVRARGTTHEEIVAQILDTVPAPVHAQA